MTSPIGKTRAFEADNLAAARVILADPTASGATLAWAKRVVARHQEELAAEERRARPARESGDLFGA